MTEERTSNLVTYPVWANPPIIEAILDIRTSSTSPVDISVLENFHFGVEDRFPVVKPEAIFELQFTAVEGQVPEIQGPTNEPIGFLFQSENGEKQVQVHRNGFTLRRLKGYENWELFSREARELWQRYIEIAQPEQATRIGLRYINQINLPFPIDDFKRYILTTPEIAPNVPQNLASYFMRLVLPDPNSPATAIINQAMNPVLQDAKMAPLFFDIDVFMTAAYSPKSEAIWDGFMKLRQFKNQIFYDSLTEETRRIFR